MSKKLPSIDALTSSLGTEDAAFTQWVRSQPDKHWAKKDLSATPNPEQPAKGETK